MSYMPGEINNPVFGHDLGLQWAQMMSNPYHVTRRPDYAEAVHYMMVADSMALTFDPEAAATVTAEYTKVGRAEELDFVSLMVEVDAIAIAAQVREELTRRHAESVPVEDVPSAERIEEIVSDHQTEEIAPAQELDEAQIEAAVLSGMKVAYFMTKGGLAA